MFSLLWAYIQYLVRELRSCKPCGTTKKKINNKTKKITDTAAVQRPQDGGACSCGTVDIEGQGGLYICHRAVGQSGEGNGTPLQDSCLENPMDGGAW